MTIETIERPAAQDLNNRREGFWPRSADEPGFPVAGGWTKAEATSFLADLDVVEAHLAHSDAVTAYRGFSICRLCGCANGNKEFSLNGWTWPEGLLHYIEAHLLKPTEAFILFVQGSAEELREQWPEAAYTRRDV